MLTPLDKHWPIKLKNISMLFQWSVLFGFQVVQITDAVLFETVVQLTEHL